MQEFSTVYPLEEMLVPPFARRAGEEEQRARSRTRTKNIHPYLAPLASHTQKMVPVLEAINSYEINDWIL